MANAPLLEDLFLSYKDKGVLFLGAFYMSKRKDVRKFQEQYHISFPVGKAKGVAINLKVRRIPELIFLSRDGEINKRYRGRKFSEKEIRKGIEMIL